MDLEALSLAVSGSSSFVVVKQQKEWALLTREVKSESDRAITRRSKQPRELWDNLEKWHAPFTQGEKLGSTWATTWYTAFRIAPRTNPMTALGQMDNIAAEMENNEMPINPSLVQAIFLAALPTTENDRKVRNLAAMANPTRGDLVRMLEQRFHTKERSWGLTTKTHGDYALCTGGPVVKNCGK